MNDKEKLDIALEAINKIEKILPPVLVCGSEYSQKIEDIGAVIAQTIAKIEGEKEYISPLEKGFDEAAKRLPIELAKIEGGEK